MGPILGFSVSDKLHDEDYEQFVPVVDAVLAIYDKVRLLAVFHDFHGWDLPALWDDVKFAATHGNKVDRVAIVGDKKWEKWMAMICKPFTGAEVRYFDAADLEKAWDWIESADYE